MQEGLGSLGIDAQSRSQASGACCSPRVGGQDAQTIPVPWAVGATLVSLPMDGRESLRPIAWRGQSSWCHPGVWGTLAALELSSSISKSVQAGNSQISCLGLEVASTLA